MILIHVMLITLRNKIDAFLESNVSPEKLYKKTIRMDYSGPSFNYRGSHQGSISITPANQILARITSDNKFQVDDTEVNIFEGTKKIRQLFKRLPDMSAKNIFKILESHFPHFSKVWSWP